MRKWFLVLAVLLVAAAGVYAQSRLDSKLSAATVPQDNMYVFGDFVVSPWQMDTTDIYFGSNVPIDGNWHYAEGAVSVQGPAGSPYWIAMDAGYFYNGAWRQMYASDSGGNLHYMEYGIFSPTGGEWGDADFNNTYPYGNAYAGTADGSWQTTVAAGYALTWTVTPQPPAELLYFIDLVTVTLYY